MESLGSNDQEETESEQYSSRVQARKRQHPTGNKKNGNVKKVSHHKGGNKKKKQPSGNFKRRFTNKNGVFIKPWGKTFLYDLEVSKKWKKNAIKFKLSLNQVDPEERIDISNNYPDIVEDLKDRVMKHFENLLPGFAPDDVEVDNRISWFMLRAWN